VSDLVLWGEDRPVFGERQVGQVVVPDRVVQAERLVAIAPRVAGVGILLYDNARYAQALQPRTEHDAALAATDDDHVGLSAVAELGLLGRLALQPCLTVLDEPVLGSLLAARALLLFVALEFGHRGKQRPGLAIFEPHVPAAARDICLEGE